MQVAIGQRLKQMRGDRSQEWLESESGLDRKKIGQIENASVDYRINTLLKVVLALKGDAGDLVFASKDSLVQRVQLVLERGTAADIALVESTINYIADKVSPASIATASKK